MDSLAKLIKSMSKSEKRHFKLFAQSFSKKDSVYIQLFDAIDKQAEYDEAILIKKLKIKHFSVSKKYLFDNILKALRLYHAENNLLFQIVENLQNITLLRHRGMIKEAIKIYEKTYEQLHNNHIYTLLIELLNTGEVLWESYLPNKEMPDKLMELHHQRLDYIHHLESIISYRALARDVKNTLRILHPIRNEEQEAEILKFLHNPLLQVPKSSNILAQSVYYECKTLCNTALLKNEEVKTDTQEAIEALENQEKLSALSVKALVNNLGNCLLACAKLKDTATFEVLSKKYQDLQENIKGKMGNRFDVVVEKVYYNYMTSYFSEQEDFKELIDLEPKVGYFWRKYDDFLDSDWKMTVSFFFAQAFFYENKLDKAQEWVEIILDEEKNNPKIPCICNARILNLMIHYEKKNFMLLYSLFRSTRRYLNKNERFFQGERDMLNFFKWVGENHDAPNLKEKINKLSMKLEELKEYKYEKNFFEEMKLHLWLEKKSSPNLTN